MKKIAVLLLLVLALAGCGKLPSKFVGHYEGTWKGEYGWSEQWTGSIDVNGKIVLYVKTSTGKIIEGEGTVEATTNSGVINGIFKGGGSFNGSVKNNKITGNFFDFLHYSARAFEGKKIS